MKIDYHKILKEMRGKRLAVIGDCMVDRFLWGRAERISPEAPVPVVHLEKTTAKLGGAANVARNISALGAEVALIGVVGKDEAGGILRGMLREEGIESDGLLEVDGRPTTVKSRIIASNQQIVRTDVEVVTPLAREPASALLTMVVDLGHFDGIVLSDYGKGVLTTDTLPALIEAGRRSGAVISVDPKLGDFSQYRGVSSLTPNQREAELACARRITSRDDLEQVGASLLQRTDAETILITRGEQGMALFHRGGTVDYLPTEATDVYDVTGAGDTVIATFTAAMAAGATAFAAATLANHAAGLAVQEVGTAAISGAAIEGAMKA